MLTRPVRKRKEVGLVVRIRTISYTKRMKVSVCLFFVMIALIPFVVYLDDFTAAYLLSFVRTEALKIC